MKSPAIIALLATACVGCQSRRLDPTANLHFFHRAELKFLFDNVPDTGLKQWLNKHGYTSLTAKELKSHPEHYTGVISEMGHEAGFLPKNKQIAIYDEVPNEVAPRSNVVLQPNPSPQPDYTPLLMANYPTGNTVFDQTMGAFYRGANLPFALAGRPAPFPVPTVQRSSFQPRQSANFDIYGTQYGLPSISPTAVVREQPNGDLNVYRTKFGLPEISPSAVIRPSN